MEEHMTHINFIALALMLILITYGTATASNVDEQNKRDWASQEKIYKLSKEFYAIKREIHFRHEEDRRKKQYRLSQNERETHNVDLNGSQR